jgi:LuxR family maltose regulon positive regulatory protein
MEAMQSKHFIPCDTFHFKRSRINKLFTEAMKYPLVIVCAGSGYGKTSAVYDFTQEYKAATVFIKFSERDNIGGRFWENCAHTIARLNKPFAKAAFKLGFPDNADKMRQYKALVTEHVTMKRRIVIMDDFHYIEDSSVIRFLEECVILNMPPETSVFLLTRSSPQLNIANLVSKGLIYNISEDDLRFTKNELAQYFNRLEIYPQPEILHEIIEDTDGWAFAINLIARSYQKAPGYSGYVRNAMKTNIFRLMETEIWDEISKSLQIFLRRLSLIDHLSIDLITLLAGDDTALIAELNRQNDYVRRDNNINTYHIHPLFLEFLTAKQELISEEEKEKTYAAAGQWCNNNGFKIDALSYYEKIKDYESIAELLYSLPPQIPRDIAKYAAEILERAPEQEFDTVKNLATMHLATYMCQGIWDKSVSLAKQYEAKFLKLPKNDPLKNYALCTLYHCWGYIRVSVCLMDDIYDFDYYFDKFCKYFSPPPDMIKTYNHCPGPWIIAVGTSKKGFPEKYIASLSRTSSSLVKYLDGFKTGETELALGELKFYKGDLHSAETFIIRGLEQARENKQFELIHRALFYVMRLSITQGNYQKAEHALKEMESHLKENKYFNRFINYDIALCWCYCILGMPEKAPNWLKENFSPYSHAAFTDNFGNQMKAWYCYTTRNYPPLLSYIREMKERESYLFGRVEMLAMEACIHYKLKERKLAFTVLQEAYKTASPNNIVIPFIELGKDMRTLTAAALKESNSRIPVNWLENINRKAASYSKRQSHVIAEFKKNNSITEKITISPRESEILTDLSHGLSRSEIAVNRNLSINTVKMVINNIYMKLGAENLADAIRIATERKIL